MLISSWSWFNIKMLSYQHRKSTVAGWETSAHPLANASDNLAGRVENRPGWVEFCIYKLYKRLLSLGKCQKNFVSQPAVVTVHSHETNHYQHNGISHTGKTSFYWNGTLGAILWTDNKLINPNILKIYIAVMRRIMIWSCHNFAHHDSRAVMVCLNLYLRSSPSTLEHRDFRFRASFESWITNQLKK